LMQLLANFSLLGLLDSMLFADDRNEEND